MQEVSFFTFVRITQHFKKCFLGALKKKFGFAGRKRGPDELFEIALHTRPFPLLFFGLAAATSVADRPRGCVLGIVHEICQRATDGAACADTILPVTTIYRK